MDGKELGQESASSEETKVKALWVSEETHPVAGQRPLFVQGSDVGALGTQAYAILSWSKTSSLLQLAFLPL